MNVFSEDIFGLLVFAAIIIAQIVAALFAKKKKQEQQQQQQQQPILTTAKAKTAAPPKSPRQKQSGSANKEYIRVSEERDRKAVRSVQNEESAAAYSQTTSEIGSENKLAAQARIGIIWSEILQPPVSTR